MYNMVYAIGRLVSDPEIKETENGRKVTNITLAVPRNYKNADGIYETDFIPVTLKENLAKNVVEYCKKDDLIAIRGRIARTNKPMRILNDDEFTIINEPMRIIADKVSFLSSKKLDN